MLVYVYADSCNPPHSSDELEDSSLVISSDAYVNGIGTDGRDSKGETRRPFYVLIPPLVGRGSNSSGIYKISFTY